MYAPPGSKQCSFKNYGGDFNVQLQSKLDTSNQRQSKSPSAILIQKMLTELGLMDVWRESHPGEKLFFGDSIRAF